MKQPKKINNMKHGKPTYYKCDTNLFMRFSNDIRFKKGEKYLCLESFEKTQRIILVDCAKIKYTVSVSIKNFRKHFTKVKTK